MALREELETSVSAIFSGKWTVRDGITVPEDKDVGLGKDAVRLNATVLYADLADSTKLVDGYQRWFAAEIYKSFLYCAAKIIRSEAGFVTAYDGDRVMAIYIGNGRSTRAVRSAMKLKFIVDDVIRPACLARSADKPYTIQHVVGIDTSDLFVARAGIRGANDLVWVGRAANHAAKLAALPESRATYMTADVYADIDATVKFSDSGTGENMWTPLTWNTFDNSTIYASNWRWVKL